MATDKIALPNSVEKGVVTDFTAAADLMRLSWSENRDQPLDYTPDFLRTLSLYPGERPVLAPAYYERGKLTAFVAGFPRTVLLNGEERALLLMTFFTVAPGYKGKGLGRDIWAECLRNAKNTGYDGALYYCVDANPSNAVTAAGARAAGFEARRIFTIKYMMRLLSPGAGKQLTDRASAADVFLRAAGSLRRDIPLKRLWSKAEVQWLQNRPGSIIVTHAAGAVLSGYTLHTADASHTPCLFVEDILWDRIDSAERMELLQRFLASASGSLVTIPLLEYADISPFVAAGFRRSRRILHAYLTVWTGPSDIAELPCMYSDVL